MSLVIKGYSMFKNKFILILIITVNSFYPGIYDIYNKEKWSKNIIYGYRRREGYASWVETILRFIRYTGQF